MSPPQNRWSDYVRETLDERNESTRGQRRLTGIPHSTVAGWMKDDIPPEMPNVIAFAAGFGKNVNEALGIAGYPPLPEEDDPDRLADQLLDLAEHQPEELTYDPDLEGVRVEFFEGTDQLSEKDRRILERVLRHARQRLLARQGLKIEGVEEE